MKAAPTLLIILTLAACIVHAQVLDRVVAVVENDFILESELDAQVRFFVMNNKIDPATPGVKEQVLLL